jgi:hypothetical protein
VSRLYDDELRCLSRQPLSVWSDGVACEEVDQSNIAIGRRSVAPFSAAMVARAEQAVENAHSLREAPTGEPGESGAP